MIEVIILGLGTSAPEMVVFLLAALEGSPELVLGITLVLGATALISPLIIHKGTIRRDLSILVARILLAAWQLRDSQLSFNDRLVLLGILIFVLGIQIVLSLCDSHSDNADDTKEVIDAYHNSPNGSPAYQQHVKASMT